MWKEENNSLVKEYVFKDFEQAFSFLNRVAAICEQENHHPEIYNVYNKVKLTFCTHDAANTITAKDYKITKLIDSIDL
jgi:4a-hydroxytetrahydrobiopterin dehydratase